ncbi:PaaX family transcriptional regulator C-terminal domain-containing protein [Nocardia sp. NPDC020380]|uniref:PaaX family transcriptional regulator C-terminal domain-containing protein n=1 Tax=Nocardia sp. NPDC020380 TaxID=3364309 RepID=UPI0037AD769D
MTTARIDESASHPRRLTARSMILSAFLGAPAEAKASEILSLAALLGLQESAVRVALTRMVAAGDLERSDGYYRLSPRLRARQARQAEAHHPHVLAWNGQWTMLIVTRIGEAATERTSLRETLRQLRFRDMRDGVWTRPNNLDLALPPHVAERVTAFTATPMANARELADELFAPGEWAATGEQLLTEMSAAATLADRFEIAAAIIRHLLDDPLLPAELSDPHWPGPRLRASYDRFGREFAAMTEAHLGRSFVAEISEPM